MKKLIAAVLTLTLALSCLFCLAETTRTYKVGLVMLIEKPGKKPSPAGADSVFEPGDQLTVFGDYPTICKAFHARERFADP